MKLHIGMNRDESSSFLDLKMANRHGLVAGATGTGKTVTLQSIAEQFSEAGVPVFATDVKGDLSGIAHPGKFSQPLIDRAEELGIDPYTPKGYPTQTWDIFGEHGKQIKATVQDIGPLIMSRLMNLTPTQASVLNVIYLMCEKRDMPLNTLDDFRDALVYAFEHAQEVSTEFGYVSPSTIGIVQRGIALLENQGGEKFFGVPEFDIHELIQQKDGLGMVNLLAADTLMESPQVYAGFIMWLMQKLFKTLPEVGDPEKPKIVFFFDEAHLLFKDAPKQLLDTIERVVRLIRSKGVGIYFVTQNPTDVPDAVLGQLGNRYQHALRAFTARDQRAVKAAAETFRPNPAFDTRKEIGKLGKGVALVSTLNANATPSMVEVVKIRPPRSHIGPVEAPRAEPTPTPIPKPQKPHGATKGLSGPSTEDIQFLKTAQVLGIWLFGIVCGVGLTLLLT